MRIGDIPYQSGDEVAFSVRVCGDGDNERRRFSVDDGDQGESHGGVGSQDENDGVASLRGLLRRTLPVERAHQEAEVEPGDVDQIALVDVLASAQPGALHAAIEDMGEGPLNQLAAPAHRLAPRAADATACATATNDREPCRGSKAAGSRAATTSPRNATQSRARCRSPQNSRSCACGNIAQAAATARPSEARSTACTPPPRTRRSSPPQAGPEADRRTRAPANAASQPTSPSTRPEPRPIAPSPSLIPAKAPRQDGISSTRLRQRAVKADLLHGVRVELLNRRLLSCDAGNGDHFLQEADRLLAAGVDLVEDFLMVRISHCAAFPCCSPVSIRATSSAG